MPGFGLGDMLKAWSGPGDFSVMSLVKNKDVASRNQQLFGDWDAQRQAGQKSLADFTNEYYKNEPSFRQQETGAISNYYNGNMERQLAGLRAQRAAAMRQAADSAIANALRQRNTSAMLQGGMGSSYDKLLGMRANTDIENQLVLDQANQARADLDALERARMGLIGQRTGIMSRAFLPYQYQQQINSGNLAQLGGLSNLDLANTFYGVQRTPDKLERLGNMFNAADEGIMNMASTASSVMGMVGGMGGMGGPKPGGGGGGGSSGYQGYNPASDMNWTPSYNGLGDYWNRDRSRVSGGMINT